MASQSESAAAAAPVALLKGGADKDQQLRQWAAGCMAVQAGDKVLGWWQQSAAALEAIV
jgi:hypothetical protein